MKSFMRNAAGSHLSQATPRWCRARGLVWNEKLYEERGRVVPFSGHPRMIPASRTPLQLLCDRPEERKVMETLSTFRMPRRDGVSRSRGREFKCEVVQET